MADTDELPDEEAGEGDEGDEPIEIEVESDDPEAPARMMIETLWAIVSNPYQEPYPKAIQITYERMMIAAMERITRICHSDLPTDQP